MIARLSEAMGAALVSNNFRPIPMDIPFPMKKNLSSRPDIYKALKSLELSRYRKIGSTFSSSEQVAGAARSDCSRLGNALCLRLPV